MKEIVKIRLVVPHADFDPTKEITASYDTLEDIYTAISQRNQQVTLSPKWVERVYDPNYEETYKKEIAQIDGDYRSRVSAALERYKKAKTADLLSKQKADAEKAAREKLEAENNARDEAARKEIALREQEQREAEASNAARQIEMQAKAVADAKAEVEKQIAENAQLVDIKRQEIGAIEKEISALTATIQEKTDLEANDKYKNILANLDVRRAELVKLQSDLELSEKHLESIDEVTSEKKM